jgi:hypothetical protein
MRKVGSGCGLHSIIARASRGSISRRRNRRLSQQGDGQIGKRLLPDTSARPEKGLPSVVLALPDRVVAAADRALDVGQQHVDVNPLLGTQRAPRTSQAARPPPVSSTVCACPASAKRRKQNKPSLKTSASGARWRARQSLMLSSSKLRTGSMTACTGCSSVSSVSTAIPRRGLMSRRPACSPSRAPACRRCAPRHRAHARSHRRTQPRAAHGTDPRPARRRRYDETG